MIRVIVVEDEPLARSRIVRMLQKDAAVAIVAECESGGEALQALRSHPCDVLFLDVQIPDLDGFQVLEALGKRNLPRVVFVTAFEQYAVRAFEMYALDYLLKPFNTDRLLKALHRARTEMQKDRENEAHDRLLHFLEEWRAGTKQRADRILISEEGRAWFLKVGDILWIQAEAHCARIHAEGRSVLYRQSLVQLEALLNPARFVRIHRSTIINLDCICEILTDPESGDLRVRLIDGTMLPVSRTYRKNLRA